MKKKKSDSVVWDDSNNKYFAKILPYSSSLSGPIIKVPNVDAFKKRGVDKVSKLFRAELSDLQSKIESFVSSLCKWGVSLPLGTFTYVTSKKSS